MNILMISTDRGLLSPETAVAQRHREYGSVVDELHIVLFALKGKQDWRCFDLAPNVHVYPTRSFTKWFYLLDAYRVGKSILCKHTITHVSAQNPFETGVVARFLARRNTFLDIQLHTDPFSPYFVKSNFMNRMRVRMMHFVLPRAQAIRVVSERVRRSVERWLPHVRITLLPIFVDVEAIETYVPTYNLHNLYPQFKTLVLVVSRFEPEKNIFLAIDAFATAAGSNKDIGMILIGEGSQLSLLKEYVRNKQLTDRVIFHGWVQDTRSALKTGDIFLLTSDFEGYGMILVEAAAAGIPIVATDVGLIGDILTDTKGASVCNPRDNVCLSRKLAQLITNPALRTEQATVARQLIEKNTLSNKSEFLSQYRAMWAN